MADLWNISIISKQFIMPGIWAWNNNSSTVSFMLLTLARLPIDVRALPIIGSYKFNRTLDYLLSAIFQSCLKYIYVYTATSSLKRMFFIHCDDVVCLFFLFLDM